MCVMCQTKHKAIFPPRLFFPLCFLGIFGSYMGMGGVVHPPLIWPLVGFAEKFSLGNTFLRRKLFPPLDTCFMEDRRKTMCEDSYFGYYHASRPQKNWNIMRFQIFNVFVKFCCSQIYPNHTFTEPSQNGTNNRSDPKFHRIRFCERFIHKSMHWANLCVNILFFRFYCFPMGLAYCVKKWWWLLVIDFFYIARSYLPIWFTNRMKQVRCPYHSVPRSLGDYLRPHQNLLLLFELSIFKFGY